MILIINIILCAKYFKLSLLNYRKFSSEKLSLVAVVIFHLLALCLLLFKSASHDKLVLSFSVSMNELEANPGSISAVSIATSKKPINKTEKKIAKNIIVEKDKNPELKKDEQEELTKLTSKSKAENLADSKQQSAVFSGDVPANFTAAYLNNPAPNYPALSRRLKEQGKVLLEVEVSASGLVEQVVIIKSSGFERLDEVALKTVKNWRFIAAKKDQQLVASKVQVPINFILE